MGGLFAAHLLRQHGWTVHVSERVHVPLSGRGAGIVTHPQLWRVLERLGLSLDGLGIQVHRRITLGSDGAILGMLDCPQTMTSWDRVFRMLRTTWPDAQYSGGEALDRITQDTDTVTAHFTGGATRTANLLVAADGIRSPVRALLPPGAMSDNSPQYAGYIAWRGLVPEAHIPAQAHADLFSHFAFCLPEGEQILGYPVAGPDDDLRPGHRRYNFVWYRPADGLHALPDLLTDITGHRHHLSIPPPLIRPALIAAMRTDAHRRLAPQFATMVDATPTPFLQPIYDLECATMAHGRIALLGDAAFVARPHLGAGVTKAAEDAVALAEALETTTDIPAALETYAATRHPAGQYLVQRARALGTMLQATQTQSEQTTAAHHRTAEAVMRETARLDVQ